MLHRYARYVMVREASLDRAEAFFRRHGEISTFVGRLIPVIRQLISVPAGLARMRLDRFAFYTAAGAGIWCAILTYIGWVLGRNTEVIAGLDALIESEELRARAGSAALALMPLVIVAVVGYVIWYRRRRRGEAPPPDSGSRGEAGGAEGVAAPRREPAGE